MAHKMDPPQQGLAVLVPSEGQKVYGIVCFKQMGNTLHVIGKVEGLTPGKHGFHIHEYGDLSDRSGTSAGGHFNPHGKEHGPLHAEQRHAGDLGNIEANEEGVATIDLQVPDLPLHFVLGRGLVVHAKADDLKSQPSGDAGDRVAVGVIGVANPKTVDQFKSMKGNQGGANPAATNTAR